MFRGTYPTTIDAKGRTSVPARFRDGLLASGVSRIIVTTSIYDPCLHAYSLKEWESLEERLSRLDPQDQQGVTPIRRFYVGGAHELEIDKMGRVLLSPSLREHARLTKDVVWVGTLSLIELWSKDGWEKARSSATSGESAAPIARVFADISSRTR